jgi:hypothetical protein
MNANSLSPGKLSALALTGALLLAGARARAVDVYQGADRFARVRKLEGRATIGHAYEVANEFTTLQLNDPVGEGDKVNLESGARLLLFFGNGSRLAATGPAQFELYRLNPGKPYEIRLFGGEVMIDNRAAKALFIDSSDGALTINSGSRALFNGEKSGVLVTALSGETVAGDEDHPIRLHGGDRLRLTREVPGAVDNAGRNAAADLTDWSDPRDQDEEDRTAPRPQDRAAARPDERDDEADNEDAEDVRARHVDLPPDVAIYRGELSRHGRWRFISGYGWTWHPYGVAASWMPYASGFWRHTPWGIFWVSYEPWGWAPYHYGSWRFTPGFGWFWIPGVRFGGAWVVFDNDGDFWSWCPAYYHGGFWRPSHHHYIRVHHDHFYNYHPPVVVINHPNTGPVQHPVFPPSPPFYPGKPKDKPQRDGGPAQEPSPPFYPGRPKDKPQHDSGPAQEHSPPFYPGGQKDKPQHDSGPAQPASPPFYPGGQKGKSHDTPPPASAPSPKQDDGGGRHGGGPSGQGGHTESPPAHPHETPQSGKDHTDPPPAHQPKQQKQQSSPDR